MRAGASFVTSIVAVVAAGDGTGMALSRPVFFSATIRCESVAAASCTDPYTLGLADLLAERQMISAWRSSTRDATSSAGDRVDVWNRTAARDGCADARRSSGCLRGAERTRSSFASRALLPLRYRTRERSRGRRSMLGISAGAEWKAVLGTAAGCATMGLSATAA